VFAIEKANIPGDVRHDIKKVLILPSWRSWRNFAFEMQRRHIWEVCKHEKTPYNPLKERTIRG